MFTPEAALIRVPEAYFRLSPNEADVVIMGVPDPSALLHRLLAGAHSSVAGRLAGAFRRLNRGDVGDEILSTMRSAGHEVRHSDPFDDDRLMAPVRHRTSPRITTLIERLWASGRRAVLDSLPAPPSVRPPAHDYLAAIDDVYHRDAYHSLSIEGRSSRQVSATPT